MRNSYGIALESLGDFVSTSPVDRGLTIGFARKAYIFPKQDNIHGFPENYKFQFLDMWKKERLGLKKANHPGSLSDLGMPIAVVSTQIGVALDFSSQRTGVMVGFKLENAIRIPSDHEGVLFLSYGLHRLKEDAGIPTRKHSREGGILK